MLRIGVVGATGYTGLELCRLLSFHPQVSITHVFSQQYAGKRFSEVYPQFEGKLDLTLEAFTTDSIPEVDVLFLAIPHATSHAYMHELMKVPHMKIVDLSADFRLENAVDFKHYYQVEHRNEALLSEIPYGLPELFKAKIKSAKAVANPGCYATSVILGLHPLVKNNLISGHVIADCKSGVSGAGRKPKESILFCEAGESFSAYNTGVHRHSAEINYFLGKTVLFSPHLVPMSRGILSTLYVTLGEGVTTDDAISAYKTAYKTAPFVQVSDTYTPNTKFVAGTNNCRISITAIPNSNQIVVCSAIDNLIKGAAGQAIQNMNIMCDIDETEGLKQVAFYL